MQDMSFMEILRQRVFIKHGVTERKVMIEEYTIRSKKDDLSNIIFITKQLLPNLEIYDDQNHLLPVMPTTYSTKLIEMYIKKSKTEQIRSDLKKLLSNLKNKSLFLIWIKLSSTAKFSKDEVRQITLRYTPEREDISRNEKLRLIITPADYPLYYSLLSPNYFKINKIKFEYFDEYGNMATVNKMNNVRKFSSPNSLYVRVDPNIKSEFVIIYSFSPEPHIVLLPKLGAGILTVISFYVLLIVFDCAEYEPSCTLDVVTNSFHIGLFILGSSLVLPMLNNDESVRISMYKWYLLPMILGAFILLAK